MAEDRMVNDERMIDEASSMPRELIEAAIEGDTKLLTSPEAPDSEAQRPEERNIVEARATLELIHKIDRCLLETTLYPVLHIAASRGHKKFVQEICEKVGHRKSRVLMSKDQRGNTPLHCAARAGDAGMVELIIQLADGQAQEILRIKNENGDIALHEAVRHAHTEVTRKLREKDPGSASEVNKAGMSPLYLAVMARSPETVEELLKSKEEASYDGPEGKTALHAAVLLDEGIAQQLLDWNNYLGEKPDDCKSIPLHYAASYNKASMVELLLKYNTSTSYRRDQEGNFPIHIAACMGNVDVVQVILKHRPDTYKLLDKNGRSFLHVAIERQRTNVVQFVHSKPSLVELLNAQDDEGNTPLHLVANTPLHRANICITSLLSSNSEVRCNIMNNTGLTPLDLATKNTATSIWKIWVVDILVSMQSVFSPERQDRINFKPRKQNSQDDVQKEDIAKESEKYSESLSLVSTIIMSVTFAAGLAVPGGFESQDGKFPGRAILTPKPAFQAFLVLDGAALAFSILATALLILSRLVNRHLWMAAVRVAYTFVCISLVFAGIAFVLGVRATGSRKWGRASYGATVVASLIDFLALPIVYFTAPLFAYLLVSALRQWRKSGPGSNLWAFLPFGTPDATSIRADGLFGTLFGWRRKTIYLVGLLGVALFLVSSFSLIPFLIFLNY